MTTNSDVKLRQVLVEAIYRQKRLFLTFFLAAMALVVLAIVFIPRLYQSDAKLIVENLRPHSSLSAQPVDKIVMNDDVTEMQINSEVELIKSQGVLRKALKLPAINNETSIREMTEEQKPLKKLASQLTVEPIHQTSIIDVHLLGGRPEDAVRNLNAILNAYFEERASVTRSRGAAEFFDQQAQQIGAKLAKYQSALSDFEATHELVDLNDQKRIQSQRIAALDDHIAAVRSQLADQVGRSSKLKQLQSTTPMRSPTTVRSLTNQYSQERLGSSLVELQNTLTGLLQRYQPTDRLVVELNEKIERTKAAIAQAALNPASDSSTDVNPVWEQLAVQKSSTGAAISGSSAELSELLRQRGLAETRLGELLAATGDYEDLSRRFQEAQTDYNLFVQKRDEARVSEALDREKVFNVSLLQAPTSSSKPVRPRPLSYSLAGLVASFCLASALALYVDTSGQRVYAPHQLDAVTGSRTLATIRDLPVTAADEEPEVNETDWAMFEYRTLLYALWAAGSSTDAKIDAQTDARSIAFTAVLPGEGVSFVLKNLAVEAARHSDRKVALLDMKLLWRDLSDLDPALVALQRNSRSGYWELEVGNPTPRNESVFLGELTSERYRSDLDAIFERIRAEFSLILLDCPSLRRSTLAVELDRFVDSYVVVVSPGMVSKRQLEQVGALLSQTKVPVLGYVLNRRSYPVPRWLYKVLWQETPA